MTTHSICTTTFNHPDTYKRLQRDGAVIVRWDATGTAIANGRALLCDKQGVIYLQDNYGWVKKSAELYKIKVEERMWTPDHRHGMRRSSDLFFTPWGARTLADAFEMEHLSRSQPPEPDPVVLPDTYTNAEDTFIDRNGFSSQLS